MSPTKARPIAALIVTLSVAACFPKHQAEAQKASMSPSFFSASRTAVQYGPYNGAFPEDSLGLTKTLRAHDPLAESKRNWSLTLWLKTADTAPTTLLAGIGHPQDASSRYLGLRDGRPLFWNGSPAGEIIGKTALRPNVWHALVLSVDAAGISHLFADGTEVAAGKVALGSTSNSLDLAPLAQTQPQFQHFNGYLALVSLRTRSLDTAECSSASTPIPGLDNLPFERPGKALTAQNRSVALPPQ